MRAFRISVLALVLACTACLAVTAAPALAAPTAPAAPARTAGPVRWNAPVLVDHSAPLSTPSVLRSVACPTAAQCLSVGADGTVVTTDDNATQSAVSGVDGGATLENISCPSASLCVIQEGRRLLTSTDPTAAHPSWTRVAPPQLRLDLFAGVTCPTDTLCIAWSDSNTLDISTDPTGGASAWRQIPIDFPAATVEVSVVACVPATTQCIAATGGVDEAVFATTTHPAAGSSAWTVTSQPGLEGPETLTCPSATLCVGTSLDGIETSTNPAAGAAGWSGGALTRQTPAGFPVTVACPSAASCVIADGDGSIATSADPAAGAASYAISPVLDPTGFGRLADTDVTCPTTSTCLIPDSTPGLATIALGPPPSITVDTDVGGTTAINGLACPAATLCLGVDDGGGILRTSTPAGPASGWHRTVQSAASDGLNGVSCPSTRFCVAVGNDDRVATSTHPGDATQWSTFKLPFTNFGDDGPTPYDLERVSCPSTKLCLVASDFYGLIESTAPTAGARTWHLFRPATANANLWASVSCPSTTFCAAGDLIGRVAVSTHPARPRSWHLTRAIAPVAGSRPPEISSLSCPSASFCLAGDGSGSIHWSTRPAGGTRAWHAVKISGGRLISASCRSRHFCVVTTARHDAYATTDPTGGARAWHDVTLPTGRFPIASAALENLRSLACAPHQVCVAASGAGLAFSGATRETVTRVAR